MTLDDLVKVYHDTYGAQPYSGVGHFDLGSRAGIAAVIRAVRDELENEVGKCLDCSASGVHDHLDEVFNRILGDAGEGVVAEDPLPHLSEREKALFVAALKGDAGPTTPPATDPAPAVCEWVKGETGGVRPSCSDIYEYAPYVAREGVCPECKAPIKFTEEK